MHSSWFRTQLIEHSCSVVVSWAGSDMCDLTNQSRLGIWGRGLKETGAKTERFRQRGNTELQNWTVREN